ncbi:MAG: penicillin-binding protein 2 [Phycisphaerae bacterium]|nr:penicillin-binding protein 2 [Phycisphaerae bacterium]
MSRRAPGTWRYDLVFGLLLVALACLSVRLFLLVRHDRPRAVQRARRQQRRIFRLPARPGHVFARTRGAYVVLAGSERVPSCFADPAIIPDDRMYETAVAVGRALGRHPRDVLEDLLARRRKRFAWLAREIPAEQARAIRALDLRAVGIVKEWRRYYPNGPLASTLLGFRRRDGAPGGGLELALNTHLAARDGRRVVLADNRRRPLYAVDAESRPARDGRSIYLCLDVYIQRYLSEALRETVRRFNLPGRTWAAGVVVEPHTGNVLAMGSVPSFEASDVGPEDLSNAVNRVISMPFEPGSVMKPIFAAAAVDAGVVGYDTDIFCENGTFRVPRGGTIGDHGHCFAALSVMDIVVHSSNIGMAKIGLMLGNARLYAIARRFGLGEPTGIALPGEDAGILRDLDRWDTYSTPRIPFGQEMAVTSLQLAMAFSALINGGELLAPRLVDHIRAPDGQVVLRTPRRVVRRVISERTSAATREVLRQVVERGTGKSCKLSRWSSLGKTGTAQIPGRGGYVDGAYTATFAGAAPADRPRLLCVISVYWPDPKKGYYGSTVAAPYVRRVLEQSLEYLDVPGEGRFCPRPTARPAEAVARR